VQKPESDAEVAAKGLRTGDATNGSAPNDSTEVAAEGY
jgi:hypothetical protein